MSPVDEAVLAVDLGGTSFRVAVIDRGGNILGCQRDETRAHEGQQKVLWRLFQAVRLVMAQVSTHGIVAIGLATPGPVSPVQGVLLTAPKLPEWRNVPLKALLEREFGITAFVNNDANLAALGESKIGAGKNLQHLVYITWSTGIGGGIIVDGKLFLGAHGLAGELGHIVVEPGGPICGCGNPGCLEAVASGSAIARMAREALARGAVSSMTALYNGRHSAITAEAVAQAAAGGDTVAQGILHRAATYMGMGVVNLIHLFDPQRVIIGGGISNIGEPVFGPVRQMVDQYTMPNFVKGSEVVPAQLGDNAGLLGASVWAFQNVG